MIKRDLLVVILALSPLLAYLLGGLGRVFAAAAAAVLLIGTAFFVDFGTAGFVPSAVLLAWTMAALAHFYASGADPDGSGEEAEKLKESKAKAAALETSLRDMKKEFTALGANEKRSLTLYSAVKLLSEAVDIEGAGRQFGKYVRDYFGTADFVFYINDLNSGLPEVFASGEGNSFASWESVAGLAGGDPSRAAGIMVYEADRTALVPVVHGGETIGFLALRSVSGDFRKDELEASAGEFSAEISLAVKRIQLFRQVEWLSQVDGLTGVYRRNALDDKIAEEIKRALAFRTTLGFMIVDIDHFKQVNDRYGHQFGDFVLKKVGSLLRSSVYETDFVGRYGGEEFGIILPRADFAGAFRKAEAIRTKIETETFSQGFNTLKLTVSIGIAHFPRDIASGDRAAGELIARADAALYKAKETGRNKVVDAAQV